MRACFGVRGPSGAREARVFFGGGAVPATAVAQREKRPFMICVPTGRFRRAWHEMPGGAAKGKVSCKDASCGERLIRRDRNESKAMTRVHEASRWDAELSFVAYPALRAGL